MLFGLRGEQYHAAVGFYSGPARYWLTRDLFHWISALIALPAVAYCGRIFFGSAWQSLRHGQTNMDVPISIGVLLAFGFSLDEKLNRVLHSKFPRINHSSVFPADWAHARSHDAGKGTSRR